MKHPQFAERQYEAAAHIELARGGASPFVPTQNIEAYIGIDAAYDPGKAHAIWRILSVHVPKRLPLSPGLWPSLPPGFHDQIPGKFASLFVQFKTPVYQDHWRAKYFGTIGAPYFEVAITRHQQRRLIALEDRVKARAVVRYASPAFWSRADFDTYDESRSVLKRSAFVPPSRVKNHTKWMYESSNGKVVLNPDPEQSESEPWEFVLRSMVGTVHRQSLREHVRDLARLLHEVEPWPESDDQRWIGRVRRYARLSDDDARFLVDLAFVARVAIAADVSWIILLHPEGDWRNSLTDEQWPPRWRWPPDFWL